MGWLVCILYELVKGPVCCNGLYIFSPSSAPCNHVDSFNLLELLHSVDALMFPPWVSGYGGGIRRWRSRRPLRAPLSPCSSPAGTPSLGCVPPPCGFPYWPRDCRQQYIHGTSMNMAVISDIKRKSKENCFVQVYLVHPQIHKYTSTFFIPKFPQL